MLSRPAREHTHLRRAISPRSHRSPRVEVICVGSELLAGKVNTHTAFLGASLSEIGLSVAREHTIGDDPAVMRETFAEAFKRSDIVLCAGGLGPTFDDLTRDVWSRVLQRPLRRDAPLVRDIEEKFRARGLAMPPANRRQADRLKGAAIIPNANGTAPGQFLQANGKVVVLLPGPTREMAPMFRNVVLPRLRALFPNTHTAHKTFLLIGVPESHVDQIVRPFVDKIQSARGCRVVHGILASRSIISMKFAVTGPAPAVVERVASDLARRLRKKLGRSVFGEDDDTLETKVGELLTRAHKTVAVAESCTGGLIAKSLTDVSGSAAYFMEGVVSYANQSKQRRLGVPAAVLEKYGAVSPQVARAMATGLRRTARTDYALSVTGVAGPTGGTPAKPVGLVYIGVAGPRGVHVKEFHFSGDRDWIRHRATVMALDLLRRALLR